MSLSLSWHLCLIMQELKATENTSEKKERRNSAGSGEESETGSLSDADEDSSKTKLNGI
jgi:hypothetical protein